MFCYRSLTLLVLCAHGIAQKLTKCCQDKPADAVAAASFLFSSHGSPYSSDPSYYAYDPSNEGPLIIEAHPPSFGALGYNQYDTPSFVQPPNDNVHVITEYSNEKKTGPVYRKSTVTRTNLDDPKRHTTIRKTDRFYPDSVDIDNPKILKTQYQSEHLEQPENNKSIYKESSSEGKESSSFNRGMHYKKSYKDPQTPSAVDHVISTVEPIVSITPKSPLLRTVVPSSIVPSSIDVTPKYSDHSKILSTVAPSSVDIQSKFTDRLSDSPLEEAGSIGKSFISNGFHDTSDDFFGGGYGYDAGKSYGKENGEHFAEAHKKKEGHKSDKAYDHNEGFKTGEEQKHGSHHHKGSSHEHGGEKKGHVDEAKKYSLGHESASGAKENDFLQKKGHRKGHKKSGFHTVHHKDEFKKDEHFFDESHDTGEESAKGHSDHEHHKKHGGEKKEGHHDSAYHDEHHKKEGGKENAHSHSEQAGHKAEKGHKSHHGEKSEHASQEGHKEAEKHGHSEKEGHVSP